MSVEGEPAQEPAPSEERPPRRLRLDLRLTGRTLHHALVVGGAVGVAGAGFFAGLEFAQRFLIEGIAGVDLMRAPHRGSRAAGWLVARRALHRPPSGQDGRHRAGGGQRHAGGMGTFYGRIARAPLSAVVIVSELAGSYDLLVPMMLAVSFVATRRWPLYPAQLRRRVWSRGPSAG